MKNKLLHKYLILTTVFVYANAYSQMVNKGSFFVSKNTDVSVYENVLNENSANIVNNGDTYLFKDLTNEGEISFTENTTSGIFNFMGNQEQSINGEGSTAVFDIAFNNNLSSFAFSLDKEIAIYGTVFFERGIVHETENGLLSFQADSDHDNINSESYANNKAKKIGASAFTFPVGDFKEDIFIPRPASIGASADANNSFFVAFNWFNSAPEFNHADKEATIGMIDMNEFWEVNNETSDELINLSLSYNEVTTPDFILEADDSEIIIVRWNGEQWINEGGIINRDTKTVATAVSGFGIFTFALKVSKGDVNPDVDFDASDSFSPDGDGVNDTFVIPGLAEAYPNFKMKVYNRYGNIVYNYQNNGKKVPNWWDGKSQGRLTISGNSDMVPAATYWYVIDFNDGETKSFQSWLYLNK